MPQNHATSRLKLPKCHSFNPPSSAANTTRLIHVAVHGEPRILPHSTNYSNCEFIPFFSQPEFKKKRRLTGKGPEHWRGGEDGGGDGGGGKEDRIHEDGKRQ